MSSEGKGYRFSGRLLYRSYFALVMCIIAIGSGLDYMTSQSDSTTRIEMFRKHFEPFFTLVIQELDGTEKEQWEDDVKRLSAITHREMYLYSLSDFSADEDTMSQLLDGEMLALFDHDDLLTFYQRIRNSRQVLGVVVPSWASLASHNNWVVALFYIMIAIAVFLLVRPFSRQLLKLKSASVGIGKGDFSTRIDLPTGSTLVPIVDAFNVMANRIEQLITSQRDLTNSVSHELRTPLARLRFAFEAIQVDTDDVSMLEQLDEMKGDVGELEELVDEMLRYAEINQIEAVIKNPQPVIPLIKKLIGSIEASHINMVIVFDASIDTNTTVDCNEHHLHRALANILRNAMRFARSRCEVRITLYSKCIHIDIADDGIGLNEKQANRVFEPFFRAEHRTKQAPGYGLGLSIAYSIAKKHGGSLSIVDSDLGGACFRLSLPNET